MPIPKHHISLLVRKIKAHTGISGDTFQQCRQITDKMADDGYFLSAHTLGRLFGIIQPPRKTYISTLNELSRYLGYIGWDHFIQSCSPQPNKFVHADGLPDTGFLVLAETRHALHQKKYRNLGTLMDRIVTDHPVYKWSVIDEIGFFARKHFQDAPLFKFLAEHPVGRDMYYRSFVDEDDSNGYFSHYLQRYFLPTSTYEGDIIFATSFLATKMNYTRTLDLSIMPEIKRAFTLPDFLGKDPNDYHIISRYIEFSILNHGNKKAVSKLVDDVLTLEAHFTPHSYSFIIGRMLRALYFKDHVGWALQHKELFNASEGILSGHPESLLTPEDLFVQLHYLASCNEQRKARLLLPKSATATHLSSNETTLLHHLTLAMLHPTHRVRLLRQADELCRELRQYWARPLIRYLKST
jgi:hypothetical protein